MIYENNDASINNITALKLIHKLFKFDGDNWTILLSVINNFLKTYEIKVYDNYIIDWWNNLKNYCKIMGYVNNDFLFNLEIISNEFSIVPKILFFNNRHQVIDVYCWNITINDKNYINIFHHYIKNFLTYYNINYEIIIN
jgi:hypothetical protein